MSAEDALGNIGTNIVSGGQLEIYNTAAAVASAHAYRTDRPRACRADKSVYPGIRSATPKFTGSTASRAPHSPCRVSSIKMVSRPTPCWIFRRRMASTATPSAPAVSARRALICQLQCWQTRSHCSPPAPTNVTVALAVSGVQITWQEPSGQIPNHYNIYRNGTLIQTVSTITPAVDYPPRGLDSYVVAASDFLGNQSNSAPAVINLPVSPVNSLSAVVVNAGQGPALSWVSTDPACHGLQHLPQRRQAKRFPGDGAPTTPTTCRWPMA